MSALPTRLAPLAPLALVGAVWGSTMPMTKTAVTVGYTPIGLIFWQLAIGAVVLSALTLLRGRRLSLERRHFAIYAMIALVGTILPNSVSYEAAGHLPAGIMAIVVSLVPMMAFPVAIAFGQDRFSALRFLGLLLGLVAITLIALPEASLPERAMVAWLPVALVAPLFYAFEGNLVAKFGTGGLDPVQTLAGASILGTCLVLPVTWATGTFIDPRVVWGAAEWSILGIGLAHAAAYSGYVWLVGWAGAVFAAQVSYLVTAFGIFWSWLLLSETYSLWVWASVAVMFTGLTLVQPRQPQALQHPRGPVQDGASGTHQ
ncbi:MAG: DMT family transporter [Pseudomonadota bacterium]